MKLYCLVFVFIGAIAFADNNTLTLMTHVADKSSANTLSLQPSFYDILDDVDLDLSFDATKMKSVVNYNSTTEDFTIEKTALSTGFDLLYDNFVGFGLDGSTEKINDGAVASTGFTSRLKVKANGFSVRLSRNDLYVRQKNDFIVGITNIKDRLTIRNTRHTAAVTYSGLRSFIFSLSYSKYNYDTSVEDMNSFLPLKVVLNRNGAAFLSQVNTLIEQDIRGELIYNFSDAMDIEFGAGESKDYVEPKSKSNDFRLGVAYYFKVFNLGGGITGVTSDDNHEFIYSSDFRVSYLF